MGQYYKAIVLKKNWKRANNPTMAYIESWDYDNGSKLMEHSYIGNRMCKAVEHMLSKDFYKCRFVWCGDYADSIKSRIAFENGEDYTDNENDKNAYIFADDVKTERMKYDESDDKYLDTYHKYIINFSKKLYVELPHYVQGAFKVHPLPILCSDGNGRGGGDYYGTNMDIVGVWAYDVIGVDDEIPKGFKELKVIFEEDR